VFCCFSLRVARIAGVTVLGAAALTMAAAPTYASTKVCDARSYGAKADGVTKSTAAIQRAIDTCAAARHGGTVVLSGGVFVSAPLVLKSHVKLRIDKGATLLGSPDHADYPRKTEFRAPGFQSLLSATDAEDVSIVGKGVIDGAGKSWWDAVRGTKDAGLLGSTNTRPRLIVFDHCKHVLLEGVTIQNSPYWQVVPYDSDDVTIRHVRITADEHSPNTDAIDPFSSSNVVIDHVYSDVGDDNIAIKSGMIGSPGPDAPSRNIAITDCEFAHGHGLSIGSELSGGAQNIHAQRIHFHGTDNGVRVKSNRDRGNDIGNITFEDITMENVKVSILISEYYPRALPEGEVTPADVQRLTPLFHDITIKNLRSVDSDWAGVVIGLPESLVKKVTMENVSIQAKKGLQIAYAEVTGSHVSVTAAEGKNITVAPNAKVELKD